MIKPESIKAINILEALGAGIIIVIILILLPAGLLIDWVIGE